MATILIVEDDEGARILTEANRKRFYNIETAKNGKEALALIYDKHVDLILSDIMMPEMDGYEMAKALRESGNDTPIIFMTAKQSTEDKIEGFSSGVDDYVVKPFEAKEVIARVKAVLRRCGAQEQKKSKEVQYDNLYINMENYELRVRGKQIDTPPKEMELIYHLASNPNRVYTRDQLLDEVWGFEYYGDSRTVDVHIKRLREKLDGVSDQWTLKTVWGVGYKFEVKDGAAG